MSESSARRAKLLRIARERGYSEPPRYLRVMHCTTFKNKLVWFAQWYDTKTGKSVAYEPPEET